MEAFTKPEKAASGTAAPRTSLRRGTARNLRCGARLALFCRTAADAFAATPEELVILALLDALLNLLLSFLLNHGAGEVAFAALPGFFFHIPLFLLLGLALARLAGDPALVTVVPVALVALSLPLELLHGICEWLAQTGWLQISETLLDAPYYYRFFPWWGAGAGLFLLRLVPRRRRAAALFAFLAIAVLPLLYLPRGDLWVSAEGGGKELHLTEEVLDAQPRLLDEQLERLLPGRKGMSSLYFVGFAGDGEQDVFMREILSVERLFDRRFGTKGRSVALINNPTTGLSAPFATETNLRQTLKRVGEVMNRDEDVLFLYLTSHGSEDHELTVEDGPLELNAVTPEDLRRMLAEAGIRWRVIAVSACYAGGFIAPLQDDHTLIMTASDATHESFGCENGADFTWFGKAYFDEALRTTNSFTAAFDTARATIAGWEKAEGETPSNPQIFVGRAMQGKLAELERELAGAERLPGAAFRHDERKGRR